MRRAIPYPCSGPRTSRVLRTINASVPWRTSVFCFIVLTMHRHFGFQQEGCHTSFGKTTGQLSRQRSRVRVSSSPPFFLKHLRWFSRNHRGPKRARFRALFCVPFRPVPSCRVDFLTLQRHLTTIATFHSLPAKTPRTRPLPELRVWLA